jgi:hypothetical protein
MRSSKQKLLRTRLLGGFVAVAALFSLGASPAHAQYTTSFYYRNPRTGVSYSQNVGNGWTYGGFTYRSGGRTYSFASGYYGRNYYSGIGYADRNFAYAQGATYGQGYYQGGVFYARRQPGVRAATAELEGPR